MEAKIPDYCEPLTGWRMWRAWPYDEALLWSAYATRWPPYEALQAQCHCQHHQIGPLDEPCPSCPSPYGIGSPKATSKMRLDVESSYPYRYPPPEYYPCGIYAWRSKELLCADISVYNPPSLTVFGTVSLWGDVRPHERGYRAQFAYPKEIRAVLGDDALLASPGGSRMTRERVGTESERHGQRIARAFGIQYVHDEGIIDEYWQRTASDLRGTNSVPGTGAGAYYSVVSPLPGCTCPICRAGWPPTAGTGTSGGASLTPQPQPPQQLPPQQRSVRTAQLAKQSPVPVRWSQSVVDFWLRRK